MLTSTFRRLGVILVAVALLPAAARGDEPQKTDPPAQAQDAAASDLTAARARLALQIDNTYFERLATFDLNVDQMLVSGNGLGIDVAAPEATLRAQLGLDEQAGLVVTAAPEESQGAKAGLKVHDVIVQLGGQKIGPPEKMIELLEAADGQLVKLRILRSGKVVEIEATPKKPKLATVQWSRLADFHNLENVVVADEYRIGVHLSEADDTLRNQLRLATGEGLVVTEVVADSPAAKAGIQPHDVLIVLDGKRLMTVETINAQIKEIKEKAVELRLLRGGKELALEIAPRKSQDAALATPTIRYWDTKSCQNCHSNVHDLAHTQMAWKLRANHSAWTDGHSSKLFLHDWVRKTKEADGATGPQQQIESLKSQLAEMQKTLAALEDSFHQPAKTEEKKD